MVPKRSLGALVALTLAGAMPAVTKASFAPANGSGHAATLRSNTSLFEYEEAGHLQAFYAPGEQAPSSVHALTTPKHDGCLVVDTGGELECDNTHTILFDYAAEDIRTLAKYGVYAAAGSRGTSPHSLVSLEQPTFVIRNIEEANVEGALMPLPVAAGPGLIGLAVVGIIKRMV